MPGSQSLFLADAWGAHCCLVLLAEYLSKGESQALGSTPLRRHTQIFLVVRRSDERGLVSGDRSRCILCGDLLLKGTQVLGGPGTNSSDWPSRPAFRLIESTVWEKSDKYKWLVGSVAVLAFFKSARALSVTG